MPTLFLIKHALPDIDPAVPAKEWTLGAEGQRQARELAGALWPRPDVVVSSTEPKAVETGQLIANRAESTLFEPDSHLCEHDRSGAGFLSKEAFNNAVARFFSTPQRLVFGSETADEAHARFECAVKHHCARHAGKHLAIVCHGTVLSLWVSRRLGCDPFALWKALALPAWVSTQHPAFDAITVFPGLATAGDSRPWHPPA